MYDKKSELKICWNSKEASTLQSYSYTIYLGN